jgi:hypothetical protein
MVEQRKKILLNLIQSARNHKYGCLYIEVIMGAVVAVVKPILLQIATHPAVKNLVISLLEKYVKSTDNSIDDVLFATVKEALFKPQA